MAIPTVQLTGDALFLIGHEKDGRRRIKKRPLSLGLGACLIAELLATGHVALIGDRINPITADFRGNPIRPPRDGLAETVLEQIVQYHDDGDATIRNWLHLLGAGAGDDQPGSYDRIGDRLDRAGVVVRRQGWRRHPRYVQVNPTDCNEPLIRVSFMLTHPDSKVEFTTQDIVLAGLTSATGLLGEVLWLEKSVEPGKSHCEQLIKTLDRQYIDLIAHTKAALDDAVMAAH